MSLLRKLYFEEPKDSICKEKGHVATEREYIVKKKCEFSS